MGVRIQGTLRKEHQEYNGLEAIADQLERAGTRVMVVAEVEAVGYEVDFTKGGVRSPKVRFVSIEPVSTADDVLAVRKLRDAAYSARTGQAAPPPSLFDEDAVYTRAGLHRDEAGEPNDEGGLDEGGDPAPAAVFSDGAEAADGPDTGEPWPGDAEAGDRPDTADTAG